MTQSPPDCEIHLNLQAGQDTTPFRAVIRQPLTWLVILAVYALHTCFAFQPRQVFSYDDSWYAEMSIRLLDAWSRDGVPGAYAVFMRAFGGIKSPLIILLPQPLLLLFGRHDFAFLQTNALCLVVASLYLAALARLIGIQRGIPLLVLIFSAMPLTVDISRRFFVEIPLTTLGLMFVYHAIRSEQLTNRRHSLAAGLILGLGVLAKVTFPAFVAGVLLLLFCAGLRRPSSWPRALAAGLAGAFGPLVAVAAAGHLPHPLRIGACCSAVAMLALTLRGSRYQLNLAGATLLALWAPLPWYLRNGATIFGFAYSASVGDLSMDYGPRQILDLAAIRQFWELNLIYGCGLIYVIAVVLLAILLLPARLLERRGPDKETSPLRPWLLLATWALPAMIAFTLGRNRTTRFLMPLLPVAALLFGLLYDQLARRSRLSAWGAGGLAGLASLVSLSILTFGGPEIRSGRGNHLLWLSPNLTIMSRVTKPTVPLDQIVVAAGQVAAPVRDHPPLAMFLTDTVHVNQNTALYQAAKTCDPIFFGLVPYIWSYEKPLEALARADILLYQDGGADFSPVANRGGEPILNQLKNGQLPGWTILPEPSVRLPDGGVVRFVQRMAITTVPALEPCLVRYGPFALISYRIDRNADGLRLVTCWQKQQPDAGCYTVAAHLIEPSSGYFLNIDHPPPGGPEAFAAMTVGEVVTATRNQPPGDWQQKAEYLEICLYDMDRKIGLPGEIIHGFLPTPGNSPRIKLPPEDSSRPATRPAPAT